LSGLSGADKMGNEKGSTVGHRLKRSERRKALKRKPEFGFKGLSGLEKGAEFKKTLLGRTFRTEEKEKVGNR